MAGRASGSKLGVRLTSDAEPSENTSFAKQLGTASPAK
jgi:hypothetical protein